MGTRDGHPSTVARSPRAPQVSATALTCAADGVSFAGLADVIVDPAHRGRRLGAALVDRILEDLEPRGLKRIVLKASEAGRPLYEQAGWTPLEGPYDWMELRSR
ncbi:GNAT family N-acetyltransferase [Brachybacterium paraconglomeratum]|uniref:GNAT family N-acetyltransferase n=1 Tax=Brachybacterium paraconglomeratum TaxID=173362 RepID=UPI0037C58F7E